MNNDKFYISKLRHVKLLIFIHHLIHNIHINFIIIFISYYLLICSYIQDNEDYVFHFLLFFLVHSNQMKLDKVIHFLKLTYKSFKHIHFAYKLRHCKLDKIYNFTWNHSTSKFHFNCKRVLFLFSILHFYLNFNLQCVQDIHYKIYLNIYYNDHINSIILCNF